MACSSPSSSPVSLHYYPSLCLSPLHLQRSWAVVVSAIILECHISLVLAYCASTYRPHCLAERINLGVLILYLKLSFKKLGFTVWTPGSSWYWFCVVPLGLPKLFVSGTSSYWRIRSLKWLLIQCGCTFVPKLVDQMVFLMEMECKSAIVIGVNKLFCFCNVYGDVYRFPASLLRRLYQISSLVLA